MATLMPRTSFTSIIHTPLHYKVSVLFIGLCAIEIIKNVKTSSVNIVYYTIQYLSLRRCTLSYNVVSVNSAEPVRNYC